MLNAIILFSNLFRSRSISAERLYSFGVVVQQALTLANDKKQFDTIITSLTEGLAALKKEISGVDVNLNTQKSETLTVDQFVVSFHQYMSENEPFIARLLGGKRSAGYMAFYPSGITEYGKALRTDIPKLTLRVKTAATRYADKLEPEMVEMMQSFDGDFEALYTSQQTQIQLVKSDRTERNSAFVNTQLVLTQAVYTVGLQYPGNVQKCSSFFPFAMLYPHNKRESVTAKGSLAKGGVETLLNKQLLKTATIQLLNTGDNASFAIWSAAVPDAPMPASAVVVSAISDAITIEAASLGNTETNTFYIVKNLSDINSYSYEVTFTGIKKKKEKAAKAAGNAAVLEVVSA